MRNVFQCYKWIRAPKQLEAVHSDYGEEINKTLYIFITTTDFEN